MSAYRESSPLLLEDRPRGGCCSKPCCPDSCCGHPARRWTRKRWICTCCPLTVFVLLLTGVLFYFFVLTKAANFPPAPPSNNRPPDPPLPPHVSHIGILDAELTWTAPDDHGLVITRYDLRAEAGGGGGGGKIVASGRALRAMASGLLPDTAYGFSVRAVNEAGPGNYSTATLLTTLNATAPTPPGFPFLTDSSTSSLLLAWDPAVAQGLNLSHYQFEWGLSQPSALSASPPLSQQQPQQQQRPWTTLNTSTASLSLKSLTPQTQYVARVRAVDILGGASNWSTVNLLSTDSPTAAAPAAPALQAAPPIAPDQAFFAVAASWPVPAENGAMISSFTLQRDDGQGRFTHEETVPRGLTGSGPLLASFSNLSSSTVYTIRALSVNSQGNSPWGPHIQIRTGALPPPPAPPDLFLTRRGSVELGLGWTLVPAVYRSQYQLARNDWWNNSNYTTFLTVPGGANSTADSEHLLPASNYSFRISAINANGSSPFVYLDATTANAGYCGNAADIQVFYETKLTMKGLIQGCLLSCITGGQQCAIDCIHTKVGLSAPCAACWAAEGQCTVNECIGPCVLPNSQKCADCSREKCFPQCVVCSGVPMWAYPP